MGRPEGLAAMAHEIEEMEALREHARERLFEVARAEAGATRSSRFYACLDQSEGLESERHGRRACLAIALALLL